MNLVLDEKVHQRHQSTEESARNVFPVLDRFGIRGTERNAAGCPRNRKDNVRDHKNIVPVMVVGRRDVGPPAACESSDDAGPSDQLR